MQFFTFNYSTPTALTTSPFGTMTPVSTLQSQTFPNLGAQAPDLAAISYWTSSSIYTGNADTWMSTMLTSMKSTMPSSAGTGTTANPINVLIIITDGMEDSTSGSASALTSTDITTCNAIKANGTRIAILYTSYLASTINYTGDTTFNNYATNVLPNIQSQLQSCATQNADGTYLMETVGTDGSISAALNELFAQVVQTAYLVQ
jgi:hypothetical protein